jgi:hypothetical protein
MEPRKRLSVPPLRLASKEGLQSSLAPGGGGGQVWLLNHQGQKGIQVGLFV